MLRRIKPDRVRRGMYVHAFEGSWFAHPFWWPRFRLETQDDVDRVRQSAVDAVVIDDSRGLGIDDPRPAPLPAPPVSAKPRVGRRSIVPARPGPKRPFRFGTPDPSTPVDDRKDAMRVVAQAKKAIRRLFDGVRAGGTIRSAEVAGIVDEISASLDRNRTMLIEVTRLKSRHEYTYLHSVAVCALMVNLAREIGMDAATVRLVGLGGLLHDVGKMTVDDAILNKPGQLTDAEFVEMRLHAARGHALLATSGEVPDEALDICLHHHERIDGTGYPHRLPGPQISLAARMGAICDVFDAVTSARPYKAAWTPIVAITAMDEWDGHFDTDLLFRFMKSIGVFPRGALVRLRSNRLAIVMDSGRRQARARIRAFYAVPDRAFVDPVDVKLSDTFAGDQVVARERPADWGFADWDAMRDRLLAGKALAPAGAGSV